MVLTKNCKKFVCILLAAACCLPLLSCSGSDFQTVSCPYSLRQIAMPDKNTGWGLSMENELLFTTDGVEHFETVRRYETASFDRFANAAFIDSQTAYTAVFSPDDKQLIVERTDALSRLTNIVNELTRSDILFP